METALRKIPRLLFAIHSWPIIIGPAHQFKDTADSREIAGLALASRYGRLKPGTGQLPRSHQLIVRFFQLGLGHFFPIARGAVDDAAFSGVGPVSHY